MIRINTTGPDDDKYKTWREKAEKARNELIKEWKATGQIPNLKKEIWAEFKEIFLHEVFNRKCAYCEINISAGAHFHVEHYRPKKKITESRQAIVHTGYFWLAYEWYNLLLACNHCNTTHSDDDDGEKIGHPGKANEFCIEGQRIVKPSDDPSQWRTELESEKPLLLNPYFENPDDHVTFDEDEVGMVSSKNGSRKGKETIAVCDLNRASLVEARRDAMERTEARISRRIHKVLKKIRKGEPIKHSPYFKCSEPFSAWLNHCAERVKKSL